MTPLGAFTFVLHSHLPYARGPEERWPHGEEWLHEASADTYIPLIQSLDRLAAEGIRGGVTLGLTPILLEQLADGDVQGRFDEYLDYRQAAAEEDIHRFRQSGEESIEALARMHADRYQRTRSLFHEAYGRSLVQPFRRLAGGGVIEVMTSAATHGYLPLLGRDESIGLQIRTGIAAHRRHLGLTPTAMWLPECAYRPAREARPGLEAFLAAAGIRVFFAETEMVDSGELEPPPATDDPLPASVLQPYLVRQSTVAVVARHRRACQQVWGSGEGYPGDFDYQEFHKRERVSGLHYWRISGHDVPLEGKALYDPGRARERARIQADHFAGVVRQILGDHFQATGTSGLLAVAFDTELFGHWWFEGVAWLEAVLRKLAASGEIELTTASGFLDSHPPKMSIDLPEGSWGEGGRHAVWDNPKTEWMWVEIHQAEDRLARAVRSSPPASDVLKQALRELLLLQASDWPFLITTGQAEAHAVRRFGEHVQRFHLLMDAHEEGRMDDPRAQSFWELDRVFPDIDLQWFRP